MSERDRTQIAERYFVSDLPGASIPGARLCNVLDMLQQGRPLTPLAMTYLQRQGLLALLQLARGESSYESFCVPAASEQMSRKHLAQAEAVAREAAERAKEAQYEAADAARRIEFERQRRRAEEARQVRERDPRHIAKMKSQHLRERYGLDQFIDSKSFARVMEILHRLDGGSRLDVADFEWLNSEGAHYYTESLRSAYHEREAEFYAAEYGRTSDPWNAVNASGQYRKCGQSSKALDLLTSILAEQKTTPKLKSAICTTHGGVMRDLDRLDEALALGDQAHAQMPQDFRPCTLLGAVNIELGNLAIGWDWYKKAEQRGASEHIVDHELRGIWQRANGARRLEIQAFLLRQDSRRYRWADQSGTGIANTRLTQ